MSKKEKVIIRVTEDSNYQFGILNKEDKSITYIDKQLGKTVKKHTNEVSVIEITFDEFKKKFDNNGRAR